MTALIERLIASWLANVSECFKMTSLTYIFSNKLMNQLININITLTSLDMSKTPPVFEEIKKQTTGKHF